ncbi:MFS transporter [Pseudomonas sp. NA-150]|uniref:MFS transporter n=1 Tax=Pseudomonas sp. NA-150 TaxID=3367525 RepID=UPI0037CA759E
MNPTRPAHPHDISPWLTIFLAFACTLITAGSYFAQPLASVIGRDLGMSPSAAGLVITVGQLGYCLGLLLISPLGDVLENRRLLGVTLLLSVAALSLAALAPGASWFLFACFAIGVSAIAVQLIVVLAASMSRPHNRGRVVGQVTAGLLFGVLLAWPVANLVNAQIGWQRLFAADALLIGGLALVLRRVLPTRQPAPGARYSRLLMSLLPLWRAHPELRRRALIQALLFGVFSLFWTCLPLELRTRHLLSTHQLALFGLIGAGGALAAPLAGWAADRGWSSAASLLGCALVALSCAAFALDDALWRVALAAFFISAGVQACHVISQRRVLALQPDAGNRLNSLYIATFFVGGALGSALAAPLFLYGWFWPATLGEVAALVACCGCLHWAVRDARTVAPS